MMEFLDFELKITDAGDGGYSVSVISSPAGEAQETFEFPFSALELENYNLGLQNALLRSGNQRRRVQSPDEEHVQEFGGILFDTLFPDQIRNLYYESKQAAERRGAGLRIKLRIAPGELAALPWEFLYDSRHQQYISLSRNTPIVRYLSISRPTRPLVVNPPLRILAMIASPSDQDALNVTVEKQRLDRSLEKLEAEGLVVLDWLEGQNWRDLQEALFQNQYHVFHFIGHGYFDEAKEEGMVVFVDQKGRSRHFSATDLARLLADHTTLRFVVLNSCEGGKTDEYDAFSSTAATLVRRGIPAVIAMQYDITDDAAIQMAGTFYQALSHGLPVDAALAEARKSINFALNGSLEWGTPVLFTHTADGRIFDVDQAALLAAGTKAETKTDKPPPATVLEEATAKRNGGWRRYLVGVMLLLTLSVVGIALAGKILPPIFPPKPTPQPKITPITPSATSVAIAVNTSTPTDAPIETPTTSVAPPGVIAPATSTNIPAVATKTPTRVPTDTTSVPTPTNMPTEEMYQTIKDKQGTISVEIPAAWSDVQEDLQWSSDQTRIINLYAASDLEASYNDWRISALRMRYYDAQVGIINQGDYLKSFDYTDNCKAVKRSELTKRFYTGLSDVWTGCGDANVSVWILELTPENNDYLLGIAIYSGSELDLIARDRILDHILDSFTVTAPTLTRCPGARETSIRTGITARVSTEEEGLWLRKAAGYDKQGLKLLKPDTLIPVIGGPVCINGEWWWQVREPADSVGWVVDGSDSKDPYFILPADSRDSGDIWVPYNDQIIVDGWWKEWSDNDWKSLRGDEVVVYGRENYQGISDISAWYQVAWSDEGLWLAIAVTDDVIRSRSAPEKSFRNDGIDIAFDRDLPGDVNVSEANEDDYQIVIAVNEDLDDISVYRFLPSGRKGVVHEDIQWVVGPIDDGYGLELLLPWSVFDVTSPREGQRYGFAFSVNDNDSDSDKLQTMISSSPERTRPDLPQTWNVLTLGPQ